MHKKRTSIKTKKIYKIIKPELTRQFCVSSGLYCYATVLMATQAVACLRVFNSITNDTTNKATLITCEVERQPTKPR